MTVKRPLYNARGSCPLGVPHASKKSFRKQAWNDTGMEGEPFKCRKLLGLKPRKSQERLSC